ncbi:MAG: WbqC family protein [Myxococcota bacterium]
MKVVVLQSNYVPWKGYFDLIHDADLFVHYDEVKYTKNDWRNRNAILTKSGRQWLTIPIAKSAVQQKISEVRIEDARWQERHFRSLYYGYKSAAHFAQLEPLLHEFYHEREWDRLIDVDRHILGRVSDMLGIATRFVDSADYALEGKREGRLLGLLKQLGATEYISGPAARDYLTPVEPDFAAAGIQITYKDYAGYPTYRQMNPEFDHAVSILDMIANVALDEIGERIWGWRDAR